MHAASDLSSWPQPADLAPLWRERGTDAAAREALVRHFLPYARMHAARLYAGRPGDELEFGDYFQFAAIALTEAVDGFDPAREVRFETYAAHRIHGAVLDGVAAMSERQRQIAATRQARQARIRSLLRMGEGDEVDEAEGAAPDGRAANPAIEEASTAGSPAPIRRGLFAPGSALDRLSELGLGVAVGLMLEGTGMVEASEDEPAPQAQMPYARLEMRQQRERLLQLADRLPEVQRQLVHWHYLQGQPFEALAARLGVTKGRVSQLHRNALTTLRRWLEHDP